VIRKVKNEAAVKKPKRAKIEKAKKSTEGPKQPRKKTTQVKTQK